MNMNHQTLSHSSTHLTPFQRLRSILRLDFQDYVLIVIYTVFIGLLTLAVPLAAQALVNTIAAGVMVQPLIVLTFGVFGALLFAGVLRLLKLSLLEKLQQRVFARICLQLTEHLPRIQHDVFSREYSPQLANRVFELVTIQKALAKILLDGPGAVLQVLIALLLMSFYSPYLLAFAVFLILFVAFVIGVLGIGGLRTSIEESYRKYHMADWLEELARCQRSFKMNAAPNFALGKADSLIVDYIKARARHFRVLFRQAFGDSLFRAVASAGVLGIGGWLVINRQMTLGQIVASEIVIVGALQGLEKVIRLLETGYDLLTGVDKVGHLTDLPVERAKGRELKRSPDGASVVCRKVRFSYEGRGETLSNLDLVINPGEHVSLIGKSGVGKSTLVALLCGLQEANQGLAQINGLDVRDLNPESLRQSVGLVSDSNEVFAGTVEDNILLGHEDVANEDLQWAIEFARLTDDLARLSHGLQTHLISEGRNLSRGQVQRLMIARAVVKRPQLLILDEGFTGVDEDDKLKILENLFAPEHNWTIINISHDPEIVTRSRTIHVMASGKIVESGAPSELMRLHDSEFTKLFPSLELRETNNSL